MDPILGAEVEYFGHRSFNLHSRTPTSTAAITSIPARPGKTSLFKSGGGAACNARLQPVRSWHCHDGKQCQILGSWMQLHSRDFAAGVESWWNFRSYVTRMQSRAFSEFLDVVWSPAFCSTVGLASKVERRRGNARYKHVQWPGNGLWCRRLMQSMQIQSVSPTTHLA
jgi:hypothetical protein